MDEMRLRTGAKEMVGIVELRSRARRVESEANVDGSGNDVGGGVSRGFLPMTAEAAEGEAQLLAMMRRSDEEVAAFAARMKAEKREMGF